MLRIVWLSLLLALSIDGKYLKHDKTSEEIKRILSEEFLEEDRKGGSQLLSFNKPATQSSDLIYVGLPCVAGKAVDGNYNNVFGTTPDKFCSHTNAEVNPWWQVDLLGSYSVQQVKIWNRQDCCAERLLPLQVQTSSDGSTWSQCATVGGTGAAGQVYTINCEATARFVRVSLTKDTADYLTLCEVEVWGNGPIVSVGNLISRNKPATQSSDLVYVGLPCVAGKAVDGNYNNIFGTTPDKFCSHTNAEVNPWWQVDLQGTYDVKQVSIWNRQDCCPERLLPLQVETSLDASNWKQCATVAGTGLAGQIYIINCVATGRYVRVSLTKNTADYLTLCEVEVWGTGPNGCSDGGNLVSRYKPTSQSSDLVYVGQPCVAEKAVDGNYNNIFGTSPDKFCSHTNAEVNPWWQVDLQGSFDVKKVQIWNRQDCCPERLLPLQIQTSSDGSTWNQCGTIGGTGVAGQIYPVDCVATARYVRISLTKNTADYLTLCEVEVYANPISCRVPDKPVVPDAPVNLVEFRNQIGKKLKFRITGTRSGNVWGTDVYSDDSNLGAAAVHGGLLRVGETQEISISILPGRPSYKGTTRNGVTSKDLGQGSGSFRLDYPTLVG
jgi:hypothetical protein